MRIFLVVISLVASLIISSQNLNGQDQHDESAIVYFYRLPNYAGSGVRMKILANNEPVVLLRNNSWYSYMVNPGEYTFSCYTGSEARLKLSLEPGKSYYIKGYLNMGFWSAIPVLELVDSVSGKAVIEGGSLRPLIPQIISMEKPKSRIGLSMGGGLGFEKVDLFVDENGDDVTLSTGGGFAIGAEAGHTFSKNFDLSLYMYYQSSSLSRTLSNASASFERMNVLITPALIIPIKGGDYFHFKLGGGIGGYLLGNMDIDASKAGGSVYKYKYNPAFGFHGSFIFHSHFSERGSWNMGLRYYNVKYEYNPSESTHTNSDPGISNPVGSGLDFIIGYCYHF